jgi:hypothetical protein
MANKDSLAQIEPLHSACLIEAGRPGPIPGAFSTEALDLAVSTALRRGDLAAAADYAERKASLQRSSKWYPPAPAQPVSAVPIPPPMLSKGKLRHDIEQLSYLRQRGILPDSFARFITNYRTVLEHFEKGSFERRELTDTERALIGDVYGRIVWRSNAPREPVALSPSWDRGRVEAAYINHPVGITVIDNVLTERSLENLHRFCIESTIWFENRYDYGRLGAFFRDGFNCPLLVQIAEEFRAALPKIIDGNSLQQLWAFKNEPSQPTTLPHADFAAVNVNLWLTPEHANLDPDTGGMIIYDIPTPGDWDFAMYNTRGDIISDYLMRNRARSVRIPYRANRAIVFNSRYFHKTDVINFSRNFEARRVNVTLLFGRHSSVVRM